MILNTKTVKPIYDKEFNKIADSKIYLEIENIDFNLKAKTITCRGKYYWKKSVTTTNNVIDPNYNSSFGPPPTYTSTEVTTEQNMILRSFRPVVIPFTKLNLIEASLSALNTNSLIEAVLKRTGEFAGMQLQIESGQNYGTVISDWDI
jgi:hypothetical protein